MSKVKLPKRGRLIHVTWDDAASNSTWNEDPRQPDIAKCVSVGYLRHKGRRRIVLAASHSDTGAWAERTTIPMGNVRAVRKLQVGRRA